MNFPRHAANRQDSLKLNHDLRLKVSHSFSSCSVFPSPFLDGFPLVTSITDCSWRTYSALKYDETASK